MKPWGKEITTKKKKKMYMSNKGKESIVQGKGKGELKMLLNSDTDKGEDASSSTEDSFFIKTNDYTSSGSERSATQCLLTSGTSQGSATRSNENNKDSQVSKSSDTMSKATLTSSSSRMVGSVISIGKYSSIGKSKESSTNGDSSARNAVMSE